MTNFPTLFFTEDAILTAECDVLKFFPAFDSIEAIKKAFFISLRRGDRITFKKFCKSAFDRFNEKSNFVLFKLTGLYPLNYALCDKTMAADTLMTVVYLAHEISDFFVLMSPTASEYKHITGNLIYEMMYLKSNSASDVNFVTPSTLTVLNKFPHLVDCIFSKCEKSDFGSVSEMIEKLINKLKETPPFSSLTVNVTNFSHKSEVPIVIEFSHEAFIHIICAIFTIFLSLSDDHTIDIDISHLSDIAEVRIKTKSLRAENIMSDSSNLSSLTQVLTPNMSRLAEAASIISYVSDIGISIYVNKEPPEISAVLTLGREGSTDPKFRYSDPYEKISSIVEESTKLIYMLIDGKLK